jgi:hypothetical protein
VNRLKGIENVIINKPAFGYFMFYELWLDGAEKSNGDLSEDYKNTKEEIAVYKSYDRSGERDDTKSPKPVGFYISIRIFIGFPTEQRLACYFWVYLHN